MVINRVVHFAWSHDDHYSSDQQAHMNEEKIAPPLCRPMGESDMRGRSAKHTTRNFHYGLQKYILYFFLKSWIWSSLNNLCILYHRIGKQCYGFWKFENCWTLYGNIILWMVMLSPSPQFSTYSTVFVPFTNHISISHNCKSFFFRPTVLLKDQRKNWRFLLLLV